MATKFFLCTTCGNVVVKVVDSGVVPFCCGKQMMELVPQTTESLMEKHLPVVECIEGCCYKVKVSTKPHPMAKEHHISFIYLETEHGGQMQYLKQDAPAEAKFCVCKDKPVAIYEYCNIHGLWKTDIKPEECTADGECGCCKCKEENNNESNC